MEINTKAEHNLVGATILDNKVFDEVGLKYNNFSDAKCQVAWKAIGQLRAAGVQHIDEIVLADHCGKALTMVDVSKFTLDIGIPNTLRWANIIRDSYIKRGVALINKDFEKWESYGTSGPEMLTTLRKKIEQLEDNNRTELPTLADVARYELAEAKKPPQKQLRGLPTGLGLERAAPAGIPRGTVTTLFGQSGNFKTTCKNNIILAIARAGFRVLDVSLEDSNALTAHRFIANSTGIGYGRISAQTVSKEERLRLDLSSEALDVAENVIMGGDIPANIDEIIRCARSQKDIAAVVIDYIQLLGSRNSKWGQKEVLDDVLRKCQLAAKRDNMAYILVSQVKQDVDSRLDHTPRINDMLGSSAMRTASKLSIGVYRPSLYDKTPKKGTPYERILHNHPHGKKVYAGLLELHLLKNVLGEANVVIHCHVKATTGTIKPFDIRPFL